MHPAFLGQVAQDHVRSLITQADNARLARVAAASSPRRWRPRRRRGCAD